MANLHYALDIVAEMFSFRKHSDDVNDLYNHPLIEDLEKLDINLAIPLPDKEADIFLDFVCHALSYPVSSFIWARYISPLINSEIKACDKIRASCYRKICDVIQLRSHPTRSPLQHHYILRDAHKHYWRNTYLAHFYLHRYPWMKIQTLTPRDYASMALGCINDQVPPRLHNCFPIRKILSKAAYDPRLSQALRKQETVDLDLLVAYEKVSSLPGPQYMCVVKLLTCNSADNVDVPMPHV